MCWLRNLLFVLIIVDLTCSAGWAAVSRIGMTTGTNSCTFSTHRANDMLLVWAYRDGNTTAPSNPDSTVWTDLSSTGANTNSARLAYTIARRAGTTSGTWTNATSMVCAVYRGQRWDYQAGRTPVVAVSGAASTTVTYPALTLQTANGTSWVVGFAGHRSTNTSLETAPSGMSNQANVVDATDEASGHDTNGGVSSWGSQDVSVGGTSSGWRSAVVEIESDSDPTAYTKFTDAFTRADNADLGSDFDSGYDGSEALQLLSNAVRPTTVAGYAAESYNGTLGDDQWCQITLSAWTGAVFRLASCSTRMTAPSTYTNYEFYAYANDAGGITSRIEKYSAGSGVSLVEESSTTWAETDVLKGVSRGSRHVLFRNGIPLLSISDGTLTSGRTALAAFVDSGGSTGQVQIDDFTTGDFTPPAGACDSGLLLRGVGC